MPRIRWNNFSRGLWLVGPGETNPEGTLRRAKGVYPLRTQAARSRSGSLSYFNTNAHSMTRFNDEYIMGAGASLMRSASLAVGSETGISGSGVFDGTKLTFAQAMPTSWAIDDTSQAKDFLFIAGGGELRKVAPSGADTAWEVTEWGIAPPDVSSMVPIQTAEGTSNRNIINACDATTGWAWTRMNGSGTDATLSLDNTRYVEGTGSLRISAILKNTEGYIERLLAAKDLSKMDDGTTTSSEEDFITFFLRISRPKHVKSIEIAFDVNGGDFQSDFYVRELAVEQVRKSKKKAIVGLGDIIRKKDEKKFLQDNEAAQRDLSMGEYLEDGVIGVARRRWTSVSIPKHRFTKSGNAGASGKTWANVNGIRITVETNKQGRTNVNIDDIKMVGGTGMQGDYAYHITYKNSETGTRSNPDFTNGPVYVKDVDRRSVDFNNTIPEPPTGSQADKIEIWRTIGNGVLFFKCKEIDATPGGGTTTTIDTVADYIGMFEGATSKLEDEELPEDNLKPEDTYEDCCGPWNNRMWWTRDVDTTGTTDPGKEGRVYYSPKGRMEAVDGFIDVGSNDDACQKLVIWGGRLFCITVSHVFEIYNNDEPFQYREHVGAPGTLYPFTVVSTSRGIIYRATDGVRIFPGMSGASDLIGQGDPLAPIWRNSTTDGFSYTFTGDHATYGRGEYYITDSTDENRTTLAVDVETGAWREIGHPFQMLYFDAEGNRLFGATLPGVTGGVWHTRSVTSTQTFEMLSSGKYTSIGTAVGSPTGTATIGEVQMRCPRDVMLTAIYVKLGTALSSGESITCNVNIDGSPDTTFTVTVEESDGTTAVGATGSISISQDELICYEFGFAGGATSATVSHITAAYTVEPE